MSTVRLTWKDPTERDDGTELHSGDIAYIRVMMLSDESKDFEEVAQVAAGVEHFELDGVYADSDYQFKLVTVDRQLSQSKGGASVSATSAKAPLPAAKDAEDLQVSVDGGKPTPDLTPNHASTAATSAAHAAGPQAAKPSVHKGK